MSPEEAIAEFLSVARIAMQHQPDKYLAMVDILTNHRRSVAEARPEVEQLLRDQPLLIQKFDSLLPPDYRIARQAALNVDRAFSFVSRVEERSRHQQGLYESFLGLMEVYHLQQRPRVGVLLEIVDLLKGHRDLLRYFFSFFHPDLQCWTSPLRWEATADFLRFAEIELREQPHKYAALVDVLTKQYPCSVAEVRTEVEQLLRGQTLLILKFNDLLPPEMRIPLPEVRLPVAFFLKVAERFRDARLYHSFTVLVDMYRSGHRPFLQITREIMALLRNHQDLRRDFLGFLTPDVRRLSWPP